MLYAWIWPYTIFVMFGARFEKVYEILQRGVSTPFVWLSVMQQSVLRWMWGDELSHSAESDMARIDVGLQTNAAQCVVSRTCNHGIRPCTAFREFERRKRPSILQLSTVADPESRRKEEWDDCCCRRSCCCYYSMMLRSRDQRGLETTFLVSVSVSVSQ